jgi:hypothetical protein
MPFAFALIGVVFIIAGVRGTSDELLTLLHSDLIGPNNFVYWILAIGVLGSIGYIDTLRPLSRALLVLVLLVLVLTEGKKQGGGGLFAKFQSAINQITQSSEAA